MSIIIKCIFIVTTILQIQTITSFETESTFHLRKILHQPFAPLMNTLSPLPSLSPNSHHHRKHRRHKHPLSSQAPSSTNHGNLFFPSAPSPSEIDSLPVFPANISSHSFNQTASSKSSTKLIAIIISLALFSVVVIVCAVVLFIQHHHHRLEQKAPVTKIERSDSIRLYPPNSLPSDTVLLPTNSPELRPLPPLPKQNHSGEHYYYNSAYDGYHLEEEFFSPIGFSGSPNAEVSSSCSVTGAEIHRSRSLNSDIRSYPSSGSASFSQTMSRCPSVASNSTTRTLTQESFVNVPIPQQDEAYTHNFDGVVSFENVILPPNPPILPSRKFWKPWSESEGTSNWSWEFGIPAKPIITWHNNEDRDQSNKDLTLGYIQR